MESWYTSLREERRKMEELRREIEEILMAQLKALVREFCEKENFWRAEKERRAKEERLRVLEERQAEEERLQAAKVVSGPSPDHTTPGGIGKARSFGYPSASGTHGCQAHGEGFRTVPGGSDRTGSGGSYQKTSTCSPGYSARSGAGREGGLGAVPNRNHGSSGGSSGGSDGRSTTPGANSRGGGDLLAHAHVTNSVCNGRQYANVTFEVGRADSFKGHVLETGEASVWREVSPLESPLTETKLQLFGRERHRWEMDPETSDRQVIDLRSVDEGHIASNTWKLKNCEPARMSDLSCCVEMCHKGPNGAVERATNFPLRLHVRDMPAPFTAGENDRFSVRREKTASLENKDQMLDMLVDRVELLLTRQDQIKQQQERDNRRISELEKFKNTFSQVQPSSDD